ncbi:MAG: 30S ribosomal protein S17 [Acidimicrobiia bacterium]|nr:30S ribosomal protein S17 [Acidimicrobiia bacterium]
MPETETTETRSNPRKVREGLVVSSKMEKTVVVAVIDRVRHRRYGKTLQRTKKLYAHDEANEVREGDRVRVQEIRPMSRQKRWRVVEVLERAR